MAHQEGNVCAHEPCQCKVPAGEKFSSDFCREAGADEVEIACDCDHPACNEAEAMGNLSM
jgi:hypothetical protein